jgi:hypothetical protein
MWTLMLEADVTPAQRNKGRGAGCGPARVGGWAGGDSNRTELVRVWGCRSHVRGSQPTADGGRLFVWLHAVAPVCFAFALDALHQRVVGSLRAPGVFTQVLNYVTVTLKGCHL